MKPTHGGFPDTQPIALGSDGRPERGPGGYIVVHEGTVIEQIRASCYADAAQRRRSRVGSMYALCGGEADQWDGGRMLP